MARFAAALRSEIRRINQAESKGLARALDGLRRQLEDVASLVRANGRALLRIDNRRGAGAGRGGRRRIKLTGPEARAYAPRALRALRARLAMSRLRFAKLLGVSPGSIFGWEKGRTVPGRASRARLARLKKEAGKAAPAAKGRGRAKKSRPRRKPAGRS
jgi:DNA-binding transcriptional regulator YiaG